jgi:hypothetical protein
MLGRTVQFEGVNSAALSSAGVIDSSGSIIPANGNGGDVRITPPLWLKRLLHGCLLPVSQNCDSPASQST